MQKHFEPISQKAAEIIECIMTSPDIPDDEALQFKIRLSVEEMVENVVNYAYGTESGFLDIETTNKNNTLKITLRDGGKPFNPLERDDPDTTSPVEDRQIGGLGIFLCKQMMDKVEYKYENNCNILTITKIIKQ